LYWIIAVVVLGVLFWLAMLAIALIFCFKRRYRRPESISNTRVTTIEPPSHDDSIKGYNPNDLQTFYPQEVDVEKKKRDSDKVTTPPRTQTPEPPAPTPTTPAPTPTPPASPLPPTVEERYNITDTVNINNLPSEPTHVYHTQTHSMVILDDGNQKSPRQSPEPVPKDYDTQSIDMKFIEEQPEWESMDIQLRIDPSGNQDPVITRKEQTVDDTESEDMYLPPPPPQEEEEVKTTTITTTITYDDNGNPIEETRTETSYQ